MRMLLGVGLITFALDQLSKYIVVHTMNLAELLSIDVLPPLLNFRMAWNYGINFGLLSGDNPLIRWVLIIVALIICAGVIWWNARHPGDLWKGLFSGLLVGGALGNVVDRLVYGAVADFLNMSCCGFNNPYAFNIADIAVFAGAFGLILFTSEKKPS